MGETSVLVARACEGSAARGENDLLHKLVQRRADPGVTAAAAVCFSENARVQSATRYLSYRLDHNGQLAHSSGGRMIVMRNDHHEEVSGRGYCEGSDAGAAGTIRLGEGQGKRHHSPVNESPLLLSR